MQTETINFVPASSIFADCPEARSQFNCADTDVSFGDADHTLIDGEKFLGMLADAELTEEELKETNHPMKMQVVAQLHTIYERLDTLGNTLIDLES